RRDSERKTRRRVWNDRHRVWRWLRPRTCARWSAQQLQSAFGVLGRGRAEFGQLALGLFFRSRIVAPGAAKEFFFSTRESGWLACLAPFAFRALASRHHPVQRLPRAQRFDHDLGAVCHLSLLLESTHHWYLAHVRRYLHRRDLRRTDRSPGQTFWR